METRYGAPVAGDEKEVLAGFLDHYRQTLLDVCSGLSDEPLRRPMVPSGTSLLSTLVLHMIEETARHVGHADILREQLDGKTGTGYTP